MQSQLSIFEAPALAECDQIDLYSYDTYIVFFSGGKDSLACLLYLLDAGVDKSKIELHHHNVDGTGERFMDWEITPAYCQAVADHFEIPLYFSWKEGGFKRELLRENSLTAPTSFQDKDYQVHTIGGVRGKLSTRRLYPQTSPDLSVRWCSSYLKISCGDALINNQERFNNSRTLTISGERGEESSARAKYNIFEPGRSDNRDGKNKRHVDAFRPVLRWTEKQVWEIIERYKIRPHVSYELGFSRTSCLFCIFGNADQFKSAYEISPAQGEEIMRLEDEFGVTIKRNETLRSLISKGTSYPGLKNKELLALARSKTYTVSIVSENWTLPSGAFKKGSCGPT